VPDAIAALREELSVANRLLANEGILDAFGHVSVRHPDDPERFLLSRHRAPELVAPDDLLEFALDGEPVTPPTVRLYSERVIHSCIYAARPDVMSVCHHHSPAVLPYCISGTELVPVYHLGATMGAKAPFWDSRDEFGDTSLLVVKIEEGRSLARALGEHWTVLMRRHGATVAGTSIRETIFRTVYSCRNAELQSQAQVQGYIGRLTPGEAEMAAAANLRPGPMERAWDYWVGRLRRAGNHPAASAPATTPSAAKKKPAASRTAPSKTAPSKTAASRRTKPAAKNKKR
jgi:ribulose-5-phosphate 4-epimerase/fuculose-1-phosphate aldolase